MSHRPLIFADSNVFVEALFIEDSHAAVVIRLVALQWYELATCTAVVNDVEKAISNKAKHSSTDEADLLNRWRIIAKATNLNVLPDALPNEVKAVFTAYIHLMRHKNDIPILATALHCKPDYILSNNREHFVQPFHHIIQLGHHGLAWLSLKIQPIVEGLGKHLGGG